MITKYQMSMCLNKLINYKCPHDKAGLQVIMSSFMSSFEVNAKTVVTPKWGKRSRARDVWMDSRSLNTPAASSPVGQNRSNWPRRSRHCSWAVVNSCSACRSSSSTRVKSRRAASRSSSRADGLEPRQHHLTSIPGLVSCWAGAMASKSWGRRTLVGTGGVGMDGDSGVETGMRSGESCFIGGVVGAWLASKCRTLGSRAHSNHISGSPTQGWWRSLPILLWGGVRMNGNGSEDRALRGLCEGWVMRWSMVRGGWQGRWWLLWGVP